MEDIDAGMPSPKQWHFMRCLFNKLATRPTLSGKAKAVFDLLEPFMRKYGMHDHRGVNVMAVYPHQENKK